MLLHRDRLGEQLRVAAAEFDELRLGPGRAEVAGGLDRHVAEDALNHLDAGRAVPAEEVAEGIPPGEAGVLGRDEGAAAHLTAAILLAVVVADRAEHLALGARLVDPLVEDLALELDRAALVAVG